MTNPRWQKIALIPLKNKKIQKYDATVTMINLNFLTYFPLTSESVTLYNQVQLGLLAVQTLHRIVETSFADGMTLKCNLQMVLTIQLAS